MRVLPVLAVAILSCPVPLWGQGAPEDSARVRFQAVLEHEKLGESSGLALNLGQPGLFWTLNDSGNGADLFAIDSTGRNRGVFRVREAENRDWEAIASQRCGQANCLYLANTGDNRRNRRSVRIYRVIEPATRSSSGGTVGVDAVVTFRYDGGPRNVEAMLVTPAEDIYLITKERNGPALVFRVDQSAWRAGGTATARRVQELTLGEGLGFQVTDASLSPDGLVAVRTYRYIYFFRLERGMLEPDPGRPRCDAAGLDAQGEGITWLPDGRLATTSERVLTLGGTVTLVECR